MKTGGRLAYLVSLAIKQEPDKPHASQEQVCRDFRVPSLAYGVRKAAVCDRPALIRLRLQSLNRLDGLSNLHMRIYASAGRWQSSSFNCRSAGETDRCALPGLAVWN